MDGVLARALARTPGDRRASCAEFAGALRAALAAAPERDASTANTANLVVPGVRPVTNATGVALTPDDRFAFVTMANSDRLAVFDLARALTRGQTQPGVFVGTVALGVRPSGLAVSPDGLWLYVVSAAKRHTAAFGPGEGLVSVLSTRTLETDPGAAPARALRHRQVPVRRR